MLAGERAVIVGAGMAGLASAQAIRRFFSRITVVDRDSLTGSFEARKGIPQGNHLHLLLMSGAQALEKLFPGVLDELVRSGGLVADSGSKLAFFLQGGWMPREELGLPTRLQTRPFLEAHVLKRLRTCPEVEFLDSSAVVGARAEGGRIRGVSVAHPGGSEFLECDLLVDASGRGSHLPLWMKAWGLPDPASSVCEMGLGYASRFFENVGGDFDAMLVYPQPPSLKRGGALYRQEGGKWIVTLAGYGDEPLPNDDAEFVGFARALPSPAIAHLLEAARPISPIKRFRVRTARWTHYERVAEFPLGLAAVGDSYCHFNPIFGQGMTTALLSAGALGSRMAAGGLASVREHFFRDAADIVRGPWKISTTLDLAFPTTVGSRPLGLPLIHGYLKRLFHGMRSDPVAYGNFMRVLHLISTPTTLAFPRQVLAAFRGMSTSA